jgi:transposase-like protein
MGRPKSLFTDEEKRKAVARLANESTHDVAKDIGVDQSTLNKWARRNGIKRKRGHPFYDDATKRAVVARVMAGEPRKDVAKETGIATRTITVWKNQLAGAEQPKEPRDLVKGKPRVKPYHERRLWTDEEKLAALARVAAGEQKKAVAQDIGVYPTMLRAWERHFSKHPPKRAYVRRAPELPGSNRPLEKSVASAIALLRGVRGQIDNSDPVHLTAMLVLMTLEGKM